MCRRWEDIENTIWDFLTFMVWRIAWIKATDFAPGKIILTHTHRMINWTGGGENLLQPQEAINFSAKVHMQGEIKIGWNLFWREVIHIEKLVLVWHKTVADNWDSKRHPLELSLPVRDYGSDHISLRINFVLFFKIESWNFQHLLGK